MILLKKKLINKVLKQPYVFEFEVTKTAFYIFFISARAKSEKQRGKQETDDSDLIFTINNVQLTHFSKKDKPMHKDAPFVFSGGQLHNRKKTVVVFTQLIQGENKITLLPENEPQAEEIKIYQIEDKEVKNKKIIFQIEEQAEKGDRRPFYTFLFLHQALKSMTVDATLHKRWPDSDDIQFRINEQVLKSSKGKIQTIKWALWFLAGHVLYLLTTAKLIKSVAEKIQEKAYRIQRTISLNLPKHRNIIEIIADETPILHSIGFEFRDLKLIVGIKRIPTIDDPKWTGDFKDDTEEILMARLIFGEAEGEPREAKIWVAGSVLNRKAAKAWDDTMQQVILKEGQYDPFKTDDKNYKKIINPLGHEGVDEPTKNSWYECYEIARDIISGKIKNPTTATHFHGLGVTRNWFEPKVVPNGEFLKQIGKTYFYWSPN